ncbi:MAG: hypothetical protein AUG49_06195 [Catenulispora sp. 13_1_20CM_3_70_7]|nr:MAG: hypothetical protein AUG49_06195 [Catenulispora sp. 13_1_20CM_3_70_7]
MIQDVIQRALHRHARPVAAGTAALCLGLAGLLAIPSSPANADVTTVSQDGYRTGWDRNEPALAPANVASSSFGQLFSTPVDGQVYAQPVIVGSTLISATENDKVYGLDPATGAIKWTDDLGPAWPITKVWSQCTDLFPNIGVTSTPVYDPASGYLYLTAKVNDGPDINNPNWYMHAVNPATGAEKAGFPVKIGGSPSNDPQNVPFNAEHQAQRPGLLLLNGVVYAAFGSHCDNGPYRGYVVGVSTAGKQTAMWGSEVTWSGGGGGIWQSGGGIVADGAGHLFVATGNGVSPSAAPGSNPPPYLSESVVRLNVNADGSLSAGDFFAPTDAAALDQQDKDLASGGPMAFPDTFGSTTHPHLLVQQGKDARVFLLDRDNLGGMGQGPGGTDAAVSTMTPGAGGQWNHPAFWGGDGGYVYLVDNGAPLRALKYGLSGGTTPVLSLAGAAAGGGFGYPSGAPVVTSSGTTSGSAVVWGEYSGGSYGTGGQLRAYNAVPDGSGTLALLGSWPLGFASKFATPATDNGRVYVGTRGDLQNGSTQGTVMAFGSPTTSALSATTLSLGKVNVGSSGTATLTVTATKPVTVNGITTSAPFAVTPPALPVSLTTGQTLSVPVTFTPAGAGAVTGIISFSTDSGTVGVGVTGYGTKAGFSAAPGTVVFDQQPTATSATTNVTVTNTGTGAETISGTTAPTTPYTVTGLPANGTVVPSGGTFSFSITYAPATAGTDTAAVKVGSTSGTLTVPINGSAITGQADVELSPSTLDFGGVPVGATASASFTVSNTGNIPTTLSKAKAPGGDFAVPNPIPEGLVLGAGQTITVTVQFKPSVSGAQTTQYTITPDSGQGVMNEPITATGVPVLPTPPASWRANGAATFPATPAGSIQLTPATNNSAGSAFYTSAVPTNGLTAAFTAQMSGGTGGDGFTFALVDAAKGSATKAGAAGGGMGFSGLPGLAVVGAASWNGKLGYGNYVCIAQGPGDSGQDLNCLAAAKLPSAWGSAAHQVSVTVAGGSVKVTVDGTQLLNYAPATGILPASAFPGFTGSTGGLNNVIAVSALSIAPGTSAPTGRPLTATPGSVAFGTVAVGASAAQSVVLTNNGGAPETVTSVTAPAAPFTATLPAGGVTIAPAGTVTVPVTFAPSASTPGSQSSSFAVTTTSGTVSVALSGYGGTGGGSANLPALTDPTWHANGSATVSAGTTAAPNGGATLTADGVVGSAGTVVNGTAVNPIGLTAAFSATISGAASSGADGMTFALLDASQVSATALGQNGGGLGVAALPATFVSLNTFGDMGVYGHSSWCAVGTATYGNANLNAVATNVSIPAIRNTGAHAVTVTVTAASHLVVTLDGTQVLDVAVTLPPKVLVAFTAGDGSLTDTHAVANPVVSYTS